MSTATFYIKEGNHFKLWVSLKNEIAFEAELFSQSIPFHIYDNQLTMGSEIRYFFPDEYRVQVDEAIKSTGIIASTDTIQMTDVEDSRKAQKSYLYAAGIVALLLIVATWIFG